MDTMAREYAFELAASNIRFGRGARLEVLHDLDALGAKRVLVFADPHLRAMGAIDDVLKALGTHLEIAVFDAVRVEPTDDSVQQAATFAKAADFDALLAIGGGSTIDTAKMANLYATWPPNDFLDYVNVPVGRGIAPPGRLKPLIAIPTTAGTGSETTGVAIFDYTRLHVKTGISHRFLKPVLGILDPALTRTMPPEVAASSGLDVLCHAIESFTAASYDSRPRPERPALRPPYQGSNPLSDVWSLEALRLAATFLPRAVADPSDEEARSQMLLASAYAGVGFGHAGVHLPHAMSYPVAGMVRGFRPAGYAVDHPLVPHGISVILNAPAVFRYTAPACPERHLRAAQLLGRDTTRVRPDDAGRVLGECLTELMRRLGVPNGLRDLGYSSEDIPSLVQGTMAQQRLTKLAPRHTGPDELAALFEEAMTAW